MALTLEQKRTYLKAKQQANSIGTELTTEQKRAILKGEDPFKEPDEPVERITTTGGPPREEKGFVKKELEALYPSFHAARMEPGGSKFGRAIQQGASLIDDQITRSGRIITSAFPENIPNPDPGMMAATRMGLEASGVPGAQTAARTLTLNPARNALSPRQQEMAKTEGGGFLKNELRSTPTRLSIGATGPGGIIGKGVMSKLLGTAGKAGVARRLGAGVAGGATAGLVEGLATSGGQFGESIARGEDFDPMQALLTTGLSTGVGGALPLVGPPIRGIKKAVKSGIQKFSEIPMEVLEEASDPTNLKRIKSTFKATRNRRGEADLLPDAERILSKLESRDFKQARRLQGKIEAKVPSTGKDPSLTGEKLQATIGTTKKKIKEKFVKSEKDIFGKVSLALWPAKKGLPIQIKKHLINEGATPGEITSISDGALKYIKNDIIPDIEQGGKTIRSLINLKQKIQAARKIGKSGKITFDLTIDDKVLHDVEGMIIRKIESSLKFADKAHGGNQAVKLWRQMNRNYANEIDIINGVSEGVGKAKTSNVIGNIKSMDPALLRKMKVTMTKNPDLKPMWDEIQQGFNDDIIRQSMGKNGLESKAFRKLWDDKKFQEAKKIFLGDDKIKKIDEALGELDTGDTGKLLFGASGEKKLPQSGANKLQNIKKQKENVLQELRLIENVYGIEKGTLNKSWDAFTGSELGLSQTGGEALLPKQVNLRDMAIFWKTGGLSIVGQSPYLSRAIFTIMNFGTPIKETVKAGARFGARRKKLKEESK